MKSKIAGILTGLLLALPALAADKNSPPLSVAVYDFTDADKIGGSYGNKVTALITADLSAESDLAMVERSELKKALGEQSLGLSGMVNSDQAAKIGQLTGAKVLVSGQVIKIDAQHLVVVANIVGTETGRLFAEKAEGAPQNLTDLTAELSRKIAQNIREHAATFVVETQSHEEYLQRIVNSIKGTNRPTVLVEFRFPSSVRQHTANTEMGLILQRAGFTVVDAKSDQKPDVEITGMAASETARNKNDLYSARTVIEAKVQDRRTGRIIAVDRQVGEAVEAGNMTAWRSSTTKAVDALAERLLPQLAQ